MLSGNASLSPRSADFPTLQDYRILCSPRSLLPASDLTAYFTKKKKKEGEPEESFLTFHYHCPVIVCSPSSDMGWE